MPAYNVAEYIGDAVGSVLAQTYSDFELIIVDDGSTDGTLGVLRKFQSDPRVKIFPEPHRGMPLPSCRGIEFARGKYIAFLDSDDLWTPDKLQRHIAFFENHPGVDLTFSWSRIVDEQGRDTGLTTRLWTGPVSFAQLLADNVIGNGSAIVVRHKALLKAGGVEPSTATCHDFDLCLRIALLRPGNVRAIPEFLTVYRRHPGQLTRKVLAMEKDFERVLERARRNAPEIVSRVEKQARCNMQRFFAFGCYQNGDYAQALNFLKRSFTTAPLRFIADVRNWKMTAAVLAGLTLPERWHGSLMRATLRSGRAKRSQSTAVTQ